MIYCLECGKTQGVKSVDKDGSFILECGHSAPDEVDTVSKRIEDRLRSQAKGKGRSLKEQKKILISGLKKLKTAYCPICCKNVSTFRDSRGVLVCGGDMLNDPGCGCRIIDTVKNKV